MGGLTVFMVFAVQKVVSLTFIVLLHLYLNIQLPECSLVTSVFGYVTSSVHDCIINHWVCVEVKCVQSSLQ